MSVAALQYDKFKKQVAKQGKVFTFTVNGEYLVFPIHKHEVMPFWSSRRRMASVQKLHSQYQKYKISEMCLDEFFRWLPKLAEAGIHIGANWSGERLVGYDVSSQDLRAGIEYWINQDQEC